MFDVGTFRAMTCDGKDRRSFLKVGAALPWMLGGLTADNVTRGGSDGHQDLVAVDAA